jgi:uncharacterized protein GlcG (DUF336 family)
VTLGIARRDGSVELCAHYQSEKAGTLHLVATTVQWLNAASANGTPFQWVLGTFSHTAQTAFPNGDEFVILGLAADGGLVGAVTANGVTADITTAHRP